MGIDSGVRFGVVIFGLFSRWGGPRTAGATLLVAVGLWAYGVYVAGWGCPYLVSLAGALTTYGIGVAGERLSRAGAAPGTGEARVQGTP